MRCCHGCQPSTFSATGDNCTAQPPLVGAQLLFTKIATTRVLQLQLQDLVTMFLEDLLNSLGTQVRSNILFIPYFIKNSMLLGRFYF